MCLMWSKVTEKCTSLFKVLQTTFVTHYCINYSRQSKLQESCLLLVRRCTANLTVKTHDRELDLWLDHSLAHETRNSSFIFFWEDISSPTSNLKVLFVNTNRFVPQNTFVLHSHTKSEQWQNLMLKIILQVCPTVLFLVFFERS